MGQPVVHFEIGCRNMGKVKEFYATMFGWKMTSMGPAEMIDTDSKSGIAGHLTALGHEPHNFVNVYVEVDDLPKYLEKATSLGGRTIVPPVDIPGQGSFAWFADVEGNTIGLWKPAAKQ